MNNKNLKSKLSTNGFNPSVRLHSLLTICSLVVSLLMLLVSSSCLKTSKLLPSESPQGRRYEDQRDVVDKNVRTVRVYDEWATEAMFDVLWVSDQVREAYVDRYCLRRGKTVAFAQDMRTKELEKNNENITFFILADVRDKHHPSLADPTPAWAIHLRASDGRMVSPRSIKEVELVPEILELFGHRFKNNKFKTPYEVVFPVQDAEGNPFLVADEPFRMVIGSTERQCVLGWNGGNPVLIEAIGGRCSKKRKILKDEDYYWI